MIVEEPKIKEITKVKRNYPLMKNNYFCKDCKEQFRVKASLLTHSCKRKKQTFNRERQKFKF